MQKNKKLSARILAMALSVAMVTTMLPITVLATEGDLPLGASSVGESDIGTIKSFDKLGGKFIPSVGKDAPSHVYGLSVTLNTPATDLNLPTELTAMVARTTTVSMPAEDEEVVDSDTPSEPAVNEVIPNEDEVVEGDTDANDTVSGNQPASSSEAEEEVTEKITDGKVPLAPERSQDEETVVTTVAQEAIPVTWHSDKEYNSDANGQFVYTAEISDKYILADGVKLPQVYVMVGSKQARATGDEIIVGGSSATSGYATADYTNLQKAFTSIPTGGTVKIGADIDLGAEGISFSGTKTATLDLNGHTVKTSSGNVNTIRVAKTSSLTVTDETAGKTGKLLSEVAGSVITNAGTGTVTVSGGTVSATVRAAIYNSGTGTVTVSGGTVSATTGKAIDNTSTGTVTVSGGTVSTTDGSAISNDSGTVTVSGGTVSATGGNAIYNSSTGTVTVSGGTVSATGASAIYNRSTGIITISQTAGSTPTRVTCTYDDEYYGTIYLREVPSSAAVILNIQGGTVSNTTTPEGYSVYFEAAEVTSANLSNYYTKAVGVTVGKVKPESAATTSSISIGTQPTSPTPMTYGAISGSLTVAGTASNGNTVSYQWYKNATNSATGGTEVTGATSASFTIPTTLDAGTYYYYCVLSATDCENEPSDVVTVTINKANATDAMKTVAANVSKAGASGVTVTLPTKPAGATYGTPTAGGTITMSSMSVSGDTLTYTAPASTAGETGTITIPVTTATNYNDYSIVVTITSTDKIVATITAAVADQTYNGVAVTQPTPTAVEKDTTTDVTLNYTYQWQKKNESDAYANISGNTAPKDVGSYKLVIEGSSDTHAGTKEILFAINKATVTITANNKTAYVGDTAPALSASDCTITGLATGESLKTAPTLVYDPAAPDMTKAGTAAIKASGAAVPDSGNYVTAITYADGTLTISNKASGGGDSSGGSSGGSSGSGGGGSSSTTTPIKPTEPVIGNSNTNATVDDKGNANVNITDKNISDAVKAAKDAASKKGVNAGEVTTVINVTAPADSNPNMVTVNLPMTVQQQVISNKIGSLAIVIDKPDISIGMNLATITEMNKQANADIQLSATRTDATKLSTEAKNAIGSRPAFDLKATYASGAKSITSFGTGTVSVAIPYSLQAGEIAGGLYSVYVDGNGKVNYITNSSYDAENKVLRFSTSHFSVYGISYKAPIAYTDIASHWAKTDIEFVVNRGLMNGTSNTTFAPDSAMTRGMFVTALGRLAGVNTKDYQAQIFTDVKTDAYYAPYVNWAQSKSIVTGTTATTFAPEQSITRQEMAVIMSGYAKAMGYTIPETRTTVTFADNGSIGNWAASAVKQMQMAGILNGKNGNQFDPTGTATRGEISAILHRYVELTIDRATTEGFTTNDSGSSLYYQSGKAVTGAKTINSVAYNFNGYGETTR